MKINTIGQLIVLASVGTLFCVARLPADPGQAEPLRTFPPATAPATQPSDPTQPDARPAKLIHKPGPDNTGVRDRATLKPSPQIVATDGQVIENLIITGGVMANDTKNVTIRNCVIDAAGARYGVQCQGAENLIIERCEILNSSSAGVYGDGFSAKWNVVYQSGGDGFKPGGRCLIESNWVHTLGYKTPDAHADGVQIRGASDIQIIGNYFDMPVNVPDTKSNAAVFIQGFKGKQGSSNILVERNWCRGGNFIIHGYSDGGDASSIKIINNRFIRGSARYGVGRLQMGVVWRDNVFDDNDFRANPKDR